MFSKSLLTAFVAGLAAFAQAQDLFDPNSNPTITPTTGEVVPAGKPFLLTWTPTTPGNVNIELIAGATQNTLSSVGFVAQGIPNAGSVSWTPTNDLAAYAVVGYKVIDAATGKFQYSVPFVVGKGDKTTPTPTPSGYGSTSSSISASGYPVSSPVPPTNASATTECSTEVSTYGPTDVPTYGPTDVPTYGPTGVPSYPTTIVPTYVPVPTGGAPGYNTTSVYPTGTAPTYNPSAVPPPPEYTGAAIARKAGLSLAGAIAGIVVML